MTKAQICFTREYCTNCPVRKNCAMRPLFYSDNYAEYMKQLLSKTKEHFTSQMNFPEDTVPIALGIAIRTMDKHRKQELELHPNSID